MTAQSSHRPVLALTLGDVAGIGPEITAKAMLQHPDLRDICRPVVIGDADAMRLGALQAGLNPAAVRVITDPRASTNDPNLIELIQTGSSLADVEVGELSAKAGDGAYRFVVEACRLAHEGLVDGIVTAPLNKAAMQAGGHKWPGHTELPPVAASPSCPSNRRAKAACCTGAGFRTLKSQARGPLRQVVEE